MKCSVCLKPGFRDDFEVKKICKNCGHEQKVKNKFVICSVCSKQGFIDNYDDEAILNKEPCDASQANAEISNVNNEHDIQVNKGGD